MTAHDLASLADAPDRAALVVVDVQPDFLPGGALAVPDGDAILAPIRALLDRLPLAVAVATQDWHPRGHVSFASAHPGARPMDVVQVHGHPQRLWPDHCVQGTPGAELHASLADARLAAVIRKGAQQDVDSDSGVRNNWDAAGRRPPTGLAGYLREREVAELFVCGLARDFCVKWTAEDAAAAGFRTTVLWDLARPVIAASDDEVRRDLERAGVRVVAGGAVAR